MPKYSGACYFYYKGRRCVPLRGFTWSSIARYGSGRSFCILEHPTSIPWRLKVCSFVVVWQEQGLTCSSITRFGTKRCICTLEVATSTTGLEGVFLCGSSAIVVDGPDLHLFHWIRNKGVFFSLKYPCQSWCCIISKIIYFNITIESRNLKKCCGVLTSHLFDKT